jgi:hypothetical protein
LNYIATALTVAVKATTGFALPLRGIILSSDAERFVSWC